MKICKRISPNSPFRSGNVTTSTREPPTCVWIRADIWRQDSAICSKNRKIVPYHRCARILRLTVSIPDYGSWFKAIHATSENLIWRTVGVSYQRGEHQKHKIDTEAAWPSGLGRWCCNPEIPGSSLHPATSGICFSVVPSSNPRSRFVNSQLACLLPVGILNSVTFIWNICFLCLSGMPVN